MESSSPSPARLSRRSRRSPDRFQQLTLVERLRQMVDEAGIQAASHIVLVDPAADRNGRRRLRLRVARRESSRAGWKLQSASVGKIQIANQYIEGSGLQRARR